MAGKPAESPVIPERLKHLVSRDTRAFAALALVRQDGTPHVTMVWFDHDGQDFIINTARGRVKDRILRRHPALALAICDPQDPYRCLLVRGRVVGETEEGGYDEICDLNLKYHGDRNYPKRPGEVRVTYKIRPESFSPKQ
jgi:PPOX class probable F420-dependent enzyme